MGYEDRLDQKIVSIFLFFLFLTILLTYTLTGFMTNENVRIYKQTIAKDLVRIEELKEQVEICKNPETDDIG